MKKLRNIALLFIVASTVLSCKNADEIRKRELAKIPVVINIVEAVKPANLGSIKKISVNDFEKIIKTTALIDVRTPEEFAINHLKGAVNINFKKRTFPDYITVIDRSKPVAIYCGSGNRSGKAALIMQSLGFKLIYDLDGGVKSWKKASKPFARKENAANKKLHVILKKGDLKGIAVIGKLHQIDVVEFEKMIVANVTLLDVRTPKEFVSGHIEGAINVDWKNRHFATNAIKLISNDKPIAIYCGSGNRATRAMFALSALGFTEIYNLDKGLKSWVAANKPLKKLEVKGDIRHLDVANFNNAILGNVGTLIDVRTAKEHEDSHIPGAIFIDYKSSNFETEVAKLDKNIPVLIYCRSGVRSGRAMKIMEKEGLKVYNLNKGFLDWKSNRMPVEGKNVYRKDGGEEGC